jgi:hypothetical protein
MPLSLFSLSSGEPLIRGTKVMRNPKLLAIIFALGLALIFSYSFIAQAKKGGGGDEKESQKGGLPALEDRVEADEALLQRVFLFNADPELSSSSTITVASLSVTVGEFDGGSHRLVINYSSVGAIAPDVAANRAVLFLGCFVDGSPCVGTQANPSTTPAGWVNVLSCDFSSCAQWDNSADHVWFTGKLSPGSHTVVIEAAVGHALVPSDSFIGNPGTLFDEARNLVVTVLGSED